MHEKRQRPSYVAAMILFVGLMIPGLAWAAAQLPDPPSQQNPAPASRALLQRTRPAEAEHEIALKGLLAQMLDRRLVRAGVLARRAAYIRSLKQQISSRADWEAIAMCESTQRWHLNVGIFDGGLQFHPLTWDAYGGRRFARFAWQASKIEQMVVATRVLNVEGPGAWPFCFRWS